jgi:hypothetical protein
MTALAKGEARFKAMDKRIDKNEGRLDDHDDDFEDVRRAQKVWGVIDGGGTLGAILLALLGK